MKTFIWLFHRYRVSQEVLSISIIDMYVYILSLCSMISRKLCKSDLLVKDFRFGITFTFMKLKMQKVFLALRFRTSGRAFVFGRSIFDGDSDFDILYTVYFYI